MKTPKKYTVNQKLGLLEKQNQQTFSLLIQLSQELQHLGGLNQTLLNVVKELPGYDAAVDKLKEQGKKEDVTPVTQETSV